MILFGCLLAMTAAVAPRLVLILAWIFGDRWDAVWQEQWIWPLLGIIFLPYTTIMYLLVWSPAVAGGGNIEGWDWMWILMGLFLDIWKWTQIAANRKEATAQTMKFYPEGAPGGDSIATASAATAPAEPAASTPEPAAPAEPTAPAEPAASTPEPAPSPEASAAPAANAKQLEELENLRASGTLTDEEYEAAKAKLQS